MVTLTLDKHALIKAAFSTKIWSSKDPDGQHHVKYPIPEASHPPERRHHS
jgi:hypothetical protein